MKKLFFALSMFLVILCAAAGAYAADPIKVKVNGKAVKFEVNPVVENGSTLVPVGAISAALGFKVSWDKAANQATISKNGNTIVLTINSSSAKVNGEDAVMDVPARIRGERMLIPLRFISEKFDCTVDWYGTKKLAAINAKTDGRPAMLIERLLQSDEYTVIYEGKLRVLTPKNTELNYIVHEIQASGYNDIYRRLYDADIEISEPTQNTRNAVKDILRNVFPHDYETVYMYLIVTLRGECFEGFNVYSFTPAVSSAYHDGRDVSIYSAARNHTNISVSCVGKHINFYWDSSKEEYPLSKKDERQDIIDSYDINEYTVSDYIRVRKAQFEEELLKCFYVNTGPYLSHWLERNDINVEKDYFDALESYPIVSSP